MNQLCEDLEEVTPAARNSSHKGCGMRTNPEHEIGSEGWEEQSKVREVGRAGAPGLRSRGKGSRGRRKRSDVCTLRLTLAPLWKKD